MADKVFRLIIDVDSRKAKRGADQAEKSMARLQNRIAQIGSAAALAGAAMAGMVLRESIRNAIEQSQAVAQLEAAIRSTGGAAQLSSQQLQEMAADIQKITTVGDEAVIRMQGLLLTFKSVKGDQFKRATQAIVDMSEKMGSLESNALLLGKALDDPARRASELSRQGVVLSKTQIDLIRQFEATGQRAKAQGIILDELATQFGGAGAAAAAAAGGGIEQFKNAISDLSEDLGGPLAERLDEVSRSLLKLDEQGGAGFGLEAFGQLLADLTRGVGVVSSFENAVVSMFGNVRNAAQNAGKDVRLVSNTLREYGRAAEQASEGVDAMDQATASMFKELSGPAVRALSVVDSALEAHKSKLEEIEKQYRKDIAAIRDWIKGIQDLEQNFEDFESTVDIGGSLDNIGLEQLQANVAAAISGGILDGIPEDPPTKWDELSKALGETLSETLASALSTAIGNALSSGDIEGAIAGLGASLGQAAGLALGQGNPIAGAIGSALGGVLGDAIGGALFGDDGSEEAARKAEEAFKQLHDTIRSSMPGIRQEVIETFEAILDILRLMQEAGQATGEEMAAIGRELQNTVDSITGISTGDFADRISAAQEFNQTLLTMPENIQAAFDQIDLSALAESIAAEFMGITSHLDLSAAQRDAQHLREAISGLGLESGKTADLLRQVTQAERLRIAEIRAGALAQLADLMERAGIRSAEAAQLRAKYEQIQFQVALKRLEVELQLLNLWTKATQQIIGELTEFAGNLGNFVGGITGGLSAPLEVPRVGGRRGGGGRRQKRRDLLDELERLMNTGGGNTFADRLRDLNKQFAELRKRARKLKVPLEKVNAAYEAQLKALRDQALGGLRDFRDNLLTGPLSPLSMQQRFFAARTRFNDLARRAAGGDLDATAQLGAASQEYLDLARQMFGTTQQFDRIFDEVLGLVNGVLGIGGLKDEEATRHDQVLSQLQNTDELQLEMHGSANDWREKNWKKNRDNGRVLEEIRDVLGRLENVA